MGEHSGQRFEERYLAPQAFRVTFPPSLPARVWPGFCAWLDVAHKAQGDLRRTDLVACALLQRWMLMAQVKRVERVFMWP